MITAKELNPKGYVPTEAQKQNLAELLSRLNKVRSAFGKPMTVTSGLRSLADQMRINPSAPNSYHLQGAAADIADPDGALHTWCKSNETFLAEVGLYMEERQGLWQHFQIYPPKSGHRWFNP